VAKIEAAVELFSFSTDVHGWARMGFKKGHK